MEINELRFPDDLYYDEHHQWASARDGVVTIGLSDYAQSAAGDVVFIDLPRLGAAVQQGQPCGSIESGKWVGRIYAPVSGAVIEVNGELSRKPRTVNRDPYGAGWIARIQASAPAELAQLLRSEAILRLVQEELERDNAAAVAVPQGEAHGKS
jgi:glycine cleavage system H protein